MRKELVDEEDIVLLIDVFYGKILLHSDLSHFFLESIGNWDVHKMHFVKYWSAQILFTDTYEGTPLHRHIEIDQHFDRSFKADHFEEWIRLWIETVKELFVGEKADLAIESGMNMAKNIYHKMFLNRNPSNLSF